MIDEPEFPDNATMGEIRVRGSIERIHRLDSEYQEEP
jgi:hypothetical protein